MKHWINIAFPLAVIFILSACANQSSKKVVEKHESHDHAAMGKERTAHLKQGGPLIINDDRLNAIYEQYLFLTTALAKEDAANAKVASNAIEAGAKGLQGGVTIAHAAAKVTAAASIEVQREAFARLSNEMISLIAKAGVSNGELYVAYCPMAFDSKGALWISPSKEIQNPYFGEKMLKCGEVKDTIK